MISVQVPRAGANDDSACLAEWLVPDQSAVAAGQAICTMESSKATFQVSAPGSGIVHHLHPAGAEVPVGDPVAEIRSPEEGRAEPSSTLSTATTAATGISKTGALFTEKAFKLLQSNHLREADFPAGQLIRERDVLDRIAAQNKPASEISRKRLAAARALAQSKQQIPHSYLTRFFPATQLEERVSAFSKAREVMVSVSDAVVWSVAQALKHSPRHNVCWNGLGIEQVTSVNVGFALNLSSGELVVPVIKDADAKDLEQVAGAIRMLQKKAIRGKLAPEDLSAGQITVTSLIGTEVHQVIPILYPGQSMIIGIGDKWTVGSAQFYGVTVAFDHRALNGSEVAQFLGLMAARLTEVSA